MKKYTPIMEHKDCGIIECLLYNTEWFVCNITHHKCSEFHTDYEDNDYFDFPDDCPAKEGIIISISQD